MAKKQHKPEEEKRVKLAFGDIQFVLNNLDDGQIAELESFESNPPDLSAFMSDCVDKGMDIKIGHNAFSGGYQAIATGAYKNFPSSGYAVSGFSRSDAMDALFVLWYKVAIICQFDLSSASGRENRSKRLRG
jgi:hypothetical protein